MTKDEIRTVYPIARDRLLEAFDILEKAVFDPKDLECEALLEYCEPWENIGVEVANGVRAICTIAEMAKLPLADTAPLTDLIVAGHVNNPEGIRQAARCLIALDCRLPEAACVEETIGGVELSGNHTPHPDGPELPDKFWFDNEKFSMPPLLCRLAKVLYSMKPDESRELFAVEGEIWSAEAGGYPNVSARLTDLRNWVCKNPPIDFGFNFRTKSGYLKKIQ